MYIFRDDTRELGLWLQNELILSKEIAAGSQTAQTKRVQEWLHYRGYRLIVDGHYGPVTANVVARFQEDNFLEPTGVVDTDTFSKLTEPLKKVLKDQLDRSVGLNEAVMTYARAHLAAHPVEIGGANRGPWVRTYMKGNDGADWLWCAGFVSFVLNQACESLNMPMPIEGSFSCDSLAYQAKAAGLFVSEEEAKGMIIPAGSLFLVRKTNTDWTHVGFVDSASELDFTTVEGNANYQGSREGVEVCSISRGYSGKDFILMPQY